MIVYAFSLYRQEHAIASSCHLRGKSPSCSKKDQKGTLIFFYPRPHLSISNGNAFPLGRSANYDRASLCLEGCQHLVDLVGHADLVQGLCAIGIIADPVSFG